MMDRLAGYEQRDTNSECMCRESDFSSSSSGVDLEQRDVTLGLKLMELVGRGAFSSVYRGVWKGQTVAVKIIEDDLEEDEQLLDGSYQNAECSTSSQAALREAVLLSSLKSPHIVEVRHFRGIGVTREVGVGKHLPHIQ
jgi:serine/threonine protein kinase